jgi:hypothetical protein
VFKGYSKDSEDVDIHEIIHSFHRAHKMGIMSDRDSQNWAVRSYISARRLASQCARI